jgi:hypothetical protein
MNTIVNKLVEELVDIELLIFRRFKWTSKRLSVLCNCDKNMKIFIFSTFSFFVQQILGIIAGSQIETKRLFFLKLTCSLRKCGLYFQKNLEILIFVNTFNGQRIGCKSPYNLLKFIEMDEHLKKEFKKFEYEFD